MGRFWMSGVLVTLRAPALLVSTSALLSCSGPARTAGAEPDYWPTDTWRVAVPESQGVDSAGLLAAIERFAQSEAQIHKVLVIRHGYIVLDATFFPFQPGWEHDIASCTKSFTSTAVGLAIADGLVPGVDTPVLEFFPERDVAHADGTKRDVTLRDLLTMRSGFANDESVDLWRMLATDDWVQFALDFPMAAEPGTTFNYTSANSHLLAAVVEQATGKAMAAYLNERLLEPIGAAVASWRADPQGRSYGAGDLQLTAPDLARFGLLFLQHGRWDGRQLVPAAWVREATNEHAELPDELPDLDSGYGYQWWTYGNGIYAAQGRGGQYLVVDETRDAAIVILSSAAPVQQRVVGEVLTELLVPAFHPEPLATNPAAHTRLLARLAELVAPPPPREVPALPALAAAVSGRRYQLDVNDLGFEAVTFSFDGSAQATVVIEMAGQTVMASIGLDGVYRIATTEATDDPHALPFHLPAGLRGEWVDDAEFVLNLNEIGGINDWFLRCAFAEDHLSIRGGEVTFDLPPVTFEGRAE